MVWVFLIFSPKKKKNMFMPLCMFMNMLKKYHIFYIKLLTYVNNGVN